MLDHSYIVACQEMPKTTKFVMVDLFLKLLVKLPPCASRQKFFSDKSMQTIGLPCHVIMMSLFLKISEDMISLNKNLLVISVLKYSCPTFLKIIRCPFAYRI